MADRDAGRIASLDSLRGVAALFVLFDHCALMFPERLSPRSPPWSGGSWRDAWSWVDFTPLKLLFCGDQAVLIFFVLSGFVLALTFARNDAWSYRSYVVKRLCRIYLPFAAAILIATALCALCAPHAVAGLSGWFNAYWLQPLTPGLVAGHLAMTDRSAFQELDICMWSLVVELRISILFPLIALSVGANWWAACGAALLVSAAALLGYHFHPHHDLVDAFGTFQYVYLFAFGAALAFHAGRVRRWVEGTPAVVRAGLWLLALSFVTYPANRHFGLFVCGAAAVLLMTLCFADSRAARVLGTRGPVWLGRVSYSLYLLHVPVLMFVLHLLHGRAPLLVLVVAGATASLGVAELSYRFIETPAVKLGRRLARPRQRLSYTGLTAGAAE